MRLVSPLAACAALLAFATVPSHAAPPAAPVVTTSADFKRLNFNWQIVPQSNYYELWFRANPGSSYVKFSESVPWRPRLSNGISAHLLDWQQARYLVKACNPSGCSQSSPISVQDLFFDSLGYVTAPAIAGAHAGAAAALSEDGRTLALVTDNEPAGNGRVVVYVFAKIDGNWRQQARFVPNPSNPDNEETPAVSLSGNGNVLALGLLADDPGGPPGTSLSGAVYVFRRSGTTWTQEHRIARSAATRDAFLGYITRLDESGNTLLVVDAHDGGTATIYRHASGAWSRSGGVAGPANSINCQALTLSGDGRTVARVCRWPGGSGFALQLFSGPAFALNEEFQLSPHDAESDFFQLETSYDANVVITAERPTGLQTDQFPAVHLFDRSRGYRETLVPRWTCLDQWRSAYGSRIAISRDAKVIAVSDPADKCTGTGSAQHFNTKGTAASGAVYIYGKSGIGTWPLRRTLKSNGPRVPATGPFAGELALAENGKSLAITQPFANSAWLY